VYPQTVVSVSQHYKDPIKHVGLESSHTCIPDTVGYTDTSKNSF
jgi:hypothetical protein